tara:strand:+ start:949 stop:1596 length:648 start_codon:yes stop_codon:yes gene_type:complete
MLRFILIILVALFFGIPFLYEQSLATETKIIEMNGQEWLVIQEPGKEPMLRPVEKTKPKVVIESSIKEEPEWQRRTVKESKIVQTCNDPMGCEMTVEGDCPDCKTELVKEETVEVVQKSDFTIFKENVKAQKSLDERIKNTKTKWYLTTYDWMRDVGHPSYICWKVMLTCQHNDPISIQDLYLAKLNASTCSDFQHTFNFTNPISSCQKSSILNL